MKNKKLKIYCLVLIIITALVVRIFGISATGLVAGEEFWLMRGESIISHLLKRDIKNSTEDFERHPGIPAAFLMGISMRYLSYTQIYEEEEKDIIFPRPSSYSLKIMSSLGAARLPIALFGAASCALLFWFVLKMFKSLPLAILSGLILALDPFHIGLSRMAHQDVALSFFFMASIFFYYLGETKMRPSLKIIAAIFFGLAFLTKIVAILILVIIFIWKLGQLFSQKEKKFIFKKLPFDLLDVVFIIIGFGMFFLFYPSMWENPADGFIHHLILNLGKNTAQESYFFFGKNLKKTNFLFYLTAIPIRMTFISLIGLIIGICFWIKKRVSHKKIYSLFLLWPAVSLIVMSSAGKLKDRYMAPLWPLLAFFAAYGIYLLFRKITPKYGFLISLGSVVILTLPSVIYFYPNHLFFFNWPTNLLYGGFNIIDTNTSICLKETAEKLNKMPGTQKSSVLVSFEPGFEPYYEGLTIVWNPKKHRKAKEWPQTKYVVLNAHNMNRHSPKTLYRVFKDEEPLYSITANGYECAWVYKNKSN